MGFGGPRFPAAVLCLVAARWVTLREGGMTVRAVQGGVLVEVRVRPRSRPGWQITAGALVIRVAGAPVGGAATEEARRALAKALGVAPSRVSLQRGERSRTKVFAAAGVDEEAARAALGRAASDDLSWWS
jgi:uncharacterized protein YggU (UPF0235/DUF167 family)